MLLYPVLFFFFGNLSICLYLYTSVCSTSTGKFSSIQKLPTVLCFFFQVKSLLKWNILPFSHQSLIHNVECHTVGTVKGFLPEEVLSVFFFLHWVKCRKKKRKT